MDVFVVPIGQERYELYCEQPAEIEATEDAPPPTGVIGRLRHRFATLLRAAEEQRRHGPPAAPHEKGFVGRLQDRAMAWVAERVAEQWLLWNLRQQTYVVVAHPQDMSFDQVQTLVHTVLRRDYDRHRRWMFIDGLLFVVTFVFLGPLFLLIPGIANLPAAYFGFRTIGHFLSMRGAAHGLHGVEWAGRPCEPLGELRELAVLDPGTRDARVHAIAARLRLQHFSAFFERVAINQA